MKKSFSLALFLLSSSSLLQAKGGLEKVLGGPEEDLHLSITRAIKKQKARALDAFSGSPLLQDLKKQYEAQIVAIDGIRAHSLMPSNSSSSSNENDPKLIYNVAKNELKRLKNLFGPVQKLQLTTSFASLPIEGAPAESVKYGIALKDTSVSALAKFQAEFDVHDYHQFVEWKNYAIYLVNATADLEAKGQTERSREYKKAALRIYEEILPVGDKALESLRNAKLHARASNVRSKTTGELGVTFTTDELLESAYYDAGGLALTLGHTETALNFLLQSQELARINTIDREYLPYLIAYAWHNLGTEQNNQKFFGLAVKSYDDYFKSNPKIINLDIYVKAANAALSAEQTVEAESWMRKIIDTLKVTDESSKLKFKSAFRTNSQKLGAVAYRAQDYSTALYFFEAIVQNKAILDLPGWNTSMQYYNVGSMAYLAKEYEKARFYFSQVNRHDTLVTPVMNRGMDVWLQEMDDRESGRDLSAAPSFSVSSPMMPLNTYALSSPLLETSSDSESEEDDEKEVEKDHQYYYAKLLPAGQVMYSEMSQLEDIGPSFNVALYFDLSKFSECEKAMKAITTIQKLLMADVQALLNKILHPIEELEEFLESDDQQLSETEEKLYLSIRNRLNNNSDEDDSDEAFFALLSEGLQAPELRESKLNTLAKLVASVNVLTKFMNKIMEGTDKLELTKEILSSYLEEVPENEKSIAAGIAQNLLKASKLKMLNERILQDIERLTEDDQMSQHGTPVLPSSSSVIQNNNASTSSSTPVAQEELPFAFNPSFRGAPPLGAVPQGYTLTLDPAQKRGTQEPLGVILKGEGHVSLRGDGYVFYYKLPTDVMKQLDKKSFSFEVDVLSNTPGAYIQYWGYQNAASKKLQSTAHTGSGRWEKLRLNFTVDGSASQFFLYPAIMPGVESGSAVPEIEIRRVNLREITPEQSRPVTFNPSFKGASLSGAVPQGYKVEIDPSQTRGSTEKLSVISKGEGHVALRGDGYVFHYKLEKSELSQLEGQKVRFEVDVLSNVPGAYIQYWDYPNPHKTQSAPYDGSGEWRTLKLDFTVNSQRALFYLYPVVMPGVKEGSPAPVVEVKNVRLHQNS
ncbi:MAG: hypothetical protein K2P93_03200 [Alphaproteobacteria bacterium]|nr:hypothetical protein [Alphaproteobacteria bacterium]